MASRRRRLTAVVISVLALGLVAFALYAVLRPPSFGDAAAEGDSAPGPSTAFDPRKTAPPPTTSSARPAGSAASPSTGQGGTPDAARPATPSSTGPAKVQVVITYGGYSQQQHGVLVGGYAGPVIESNGTCTLTLVNNDVSRTAQGPGIPDAATTSCGELAVPGDQLTSGTWQATLRYRSPSSVGTSDTVPIEVP